MSENVIEVNGHTKRYGTATAVNGVTFDVAAGEIELPREKNEVHVQAERRFAREHAAPQQFAPRHVGQRELDDEVHATRERRVDVVG